MQYLTTTTCITPGSRENTSASSNCCFLGRNKQWYQSNTQQETPHQYENPSYPWQYVNTDLCTMKGNKYLLVANLYSQSAFIWCLHFTTSTTLIKQMKLLFEEQGIPEVVYSDNGLQYTNKEFASFQVNFNFKYTTSSPHYLQSNGFTERMIGICKKLLLKA